jgi:hypothetical protein
MITQQSDINLKQSEDFKSYTFGIKDSGLAHIFNVLRNQLYSDKILAVIREYSANAIDAHAEVGSASTPIKVTLPNKLNLKLKIRDFGRGLTETQIGEIYAMYGESTKRGTNTQVGQLGLGCKSAFAYGDNFVINSFVKGNITSYNAFIDPSQVGRISKLYSKKTKEKNGIEIEIPVNQDDVEAFREKAINLFQNFEVKPEIEGQSIQDAITDGDVLIGSDDDSWKIIRNSSSVAVMGNIPYPIDSYAMDFDYREDSHLRTLLNMGVRLRVDIGDLEVAASREALQYTKATKTAIRKKLQKIADALPDLLSQRFAECKSMWEAKCLYQESFGHGGFAYHLSDIMGKKGVTWVDPKGESHKVTDSSFKFCDHNATDASDCKVYIYSKNRHGKQRVKSEAIQHILASKENILILEDDRDTHAGRMNRIAPLLENYEGRSEDDVIKNEPIYDKVYLIRYRTPSTKKQVLTRNKFDAPTQKLSSLHVVKLTIVYPRDTNAKHGNINGDGASRAKHTTNVFTFDKDSGRGSWHHPKSDFFKIEEVDLDTVQKGVYVILDKFYIKRGGSGEQHPATLNSMIAAYKGVTGKDVPPIYAFKLKQEDVPKKKKGWTEFNSWFHKAMTDYLEKNSMSQEFVDCNAAKRHLSDNDTLDFHHLLRKKAKNSDMSGYGSHYYTKSDSVLIEKALEKIASNDSPIKAYFKAVESMVPSKEEENKMNRFRKHLKESGFGSIHKDEETPPSHNLDAMYQKVLDTYKMLMYFEDDFLNGWRSKRKGSNSSWKNLTNYINLVDATYVRAPNIFEEADKIEAKNNN